MVDVGVRQYHPVNRRTGEWQLAILAVGDFAPSLIEAAIQQIAPAARFHQMHRPGDFARRPPERDLHCAIAMNMMASAKR